MASFAQSFEPNALLEIHVACRQWSSHEPQNLPYVDLMFAFGFANIGDRARALGLVEDARKVMEVPVPVAKSDLRENQQLVAAIVSNYLFKAFKYRVDQALEGKPNEGSLSAELLAEIDAVNKVSRGTVNCPFSRAEYAINQLRANSRILEPQDRVDPYLDVMKTHDGTAQELAVINEILEPEQLRARIHTLLQKSVKSKDHPFTWVLTKSLSLCLRTDDAFRIDLLEQVLTISNAWVSQIQHESDVQIKEKARLFERAFFLASHVGHRDLATKLLNRLVELIKTLPSNTRFDFLNVVLAQCLQSLQKLGLVDSIGWILSRIHQEIFAGQSVAELKEAFIRDSINWAKVLQTQLKLAAGWFMIGGNEMAESIVAEAWREFPELPKPKRKNVADPYSLLAQSYVAALGEAPVQISLQRMLEFFRTSDNRRIHTGWTTIGYYSQSHLMILEEIILPLSHRTTKPHIAVG